MDGFRRMLWVGRQHSADHIPVSALQLVTCRWFKAERAKGKEQEPLFSSPSPNPALKGARGCALACFPLLRPSAPLSSGVINKCWRPGIPAVMPVFLFAGTYV